MLAFLGQTDVRPLLVTVTAYLLLYWIDAMCGPFLQSTNPFSLLYSWLLLPAVVHTWVAVSMLLRAGLGVTGGAGARVRAW